MFATLAAALLGTLLPATLAAPVSDTTTAPGLPVVIWHGLGDRFDADGLQDVADLIQVVHPGTHVHIIGLAEDGSGDQRASFFGNVTLQNDDVCDILSNDPILSAANGRIDALGFSQGGLFLRGLVERCPGIQVRSLVTFGSPHNGIVEYPKCGQWDLLCKGAEGALKSGKWSEWVQNNIVPAQYFRETDEDTGLGSQGYLNYSNWLANINNERDVKNGKYRGRLASLENFAMYMFEEDTTLLPKETSWFADVNITTGEVTQLRNRTLYAEDWLGLRVLDDKGALVFRLVEKAGHMRLTDKLLRTAFTDFFGQETEEHKMQKSSGATSSASSEQKTSLWSAFRGWGWQDVSLAGGDW